MTQEEFLEFNKRCAEFLGYELITPQMRKRPEEWKDNSYWEHKDKANVHTSKKVLGRDGYLVFHSDWNLIMDVKDKICQLDIVDEFITRYDSVRNGYYCFIHPYYKGSFEVFSTNTFLTEKEAVVSVINKFLIWYEINKI